MKRLFSMVLSAVMLLIATVIPVSAKGDYTIDSPYKDVVWNGENAWGAYKGNLHTHSFVSDGKVDFRDMILEYYRQDFDFLAMTEHGVTGKAWNERQPMIPLYLYQAIIGNLPHTLTDEEFDAVESGEYNSRGRGMTCVTGCNELNALTITKCHVNGMFLPENVGNNYLGYENDHEGAVKLTHEAGGISFIDHPGDWLHSKNNKAVLSDPKNVHYFSDILLKYDSCVGMEVFNENNSPTPYDRILFDNVLMECLPYGKRVIAFSNSDAHYIPDIDTSFSVFMMEENTVENIKETMQNGAFFCTTRKLRAEEKLGPAKDLDAKNTGLPYPEFKEVSVDGHKVTIKAVNAYNIQWVANGNVIASKDIVQSGNETTYTLDLDTVENAEDFLYIRCQLLGDGGCTLTQALVIDDGSEKTEYEYSTSLKSQFKKLWHKICSLRFFVIIEKIIDSIKNN